MAKKGGNIRKPTKAQRAAQSSRDKAKAKANKAKPKANASVSSRPGAIPPYAKLVLNPCEAKLASAPFPGRMGGQLMRLPFRQVVRLPTASTDVFGNAQTGGAQCSVLMASLFPHFMGGFSKVLSIQALPAEGSQTQTSTSTGMPNSGAIGTPGSYASFSLPGLAQLFSISSEIRPVAGCVRMGYIGPQGSNAGNYIGYEGAALQIFQKLGSPTYPAGDASYDMCLSIPPSQLALDGWSTCDTSHSIEAKVNIPAADDYWQSFRSTSITVPPSSAYVKGSGITYSTTMSDPDLTTAPVACVGVSGAVAGQAYLISGAIVFEWVPNVTLGIQAPQRTLRDPRELQNTLAWLGRAGRMLVGSIANSGGTPAGLMLDLAMQGMNRLSVGRSPGVLRISS